MAGVSVPGKRSRRLPDRAIRHNPDFLRLWLALSSSLVGSQVTALAIPLIAVIDLGASAGEMGLLAAAGQAPFLLVSLPAGVWVDRVRRRPLLIATDLGCALLLTAIPLLALAGSLNLLTLVLVAFGVGTLAALGEIAHYAYVPSLVGRDHLVDANSRIQVSYSVAESAGPGLGGLLIQVFTATGAVVLDSLSFLVSALATLRIRTPEARPTRSGSSSSPVRSALDGLSWLYGHRLLRPVILTGVASGVFDGAFVALFILYATRDLDLVPLSIGLTFAIGGLCAVPGAMLAGRVAGRVGVGPAIIGGWLFESAARLAIPLAFGPTALVIAILGIARGVEGATGTIANIHQWSLRQTVTPDALQGRVTAGHRFLVYGAAAIGALAGGALGTGLGLRPALIVCALGAIAARLPSIWSPLRTLREQPTASDR